MQYYFVEPVDSAGMHAKGFVLEKTIGPFFLFKKLADPIMPADVEE
jgi:hypothetical protein